MTADVIDRVKLAVDIVDTDRLTVYFKALGTTGFDFFSFTDFNKISHFSLLFLAWRKNFRSIYGVVAGIQVASYFLLVSFRRVAGKGNSETVALTRTSSL